MIYVKKSAILFLVLTVLTSASTGEVFHEIQADRDKARLNTTLKLDCDPETSQCPVNRWRLTWDLPENAVVERIEDSNGQIQDYERQGSQVRIVTNSGQRRTSETVKISATVGEGAEKIHKGLYMRKLNLAGFAGESTQGVMKNSEIISGWTGRNFKTSFTQDNMSFSGTGSTTVRINFGTGNKARYYEFFGGKPENSSKAYEISVGMTGLTQPFQRFPVALMSPEDYENSVVEWSAGEYVGGSFRMRKNLEEEFLPVLAHETVHGLNDRQLKWDSTSSTYLDEGTAKYVESMVQLHLRGKKKARNIFGEDTVYYERRNGTRYRVTEPSSGEKEKLWSYYRENRDFMKNWNPNDYPERRNFGYAYSELIIRNYVVNTEKTLRDLYQNMDPVGEISSNQEKWDYLSRNLDMTPCRYSDRKKFENCLEKINSYNYSIYRAKNISKDTQTLNLEPLEIKKPVKQEKINFTAGNHSFKGVSGFERSLSGFFASIRQIFLSWIGGLS